MMIANKNMPSNVTDQMNLWTSFLVHVCQGSAVRNLLNKTSFLQHTSTTCSNMQFKISTCSNNPNQYVYFFSANKI